MGTVKVLVAEKNWLRVLPSSASAVSNGVANQPADVPSVARTLPALPLCAGSWAEMPELARMAACTMAVVATCVLLVVAAAVGAVGVPVSAGDATGALASNCVWIAEVTPSK